MGGCTRPRALDKRTTLQDKFTDCTRSILSDVLRKAVIDAIYGLEELDDVKRLIELAATTDS